MKAAQADTPGSPLRLVDLPVPSLLPGEVLIRVMACGLCHSDVHIVDGDWGAEGFPKIPGHEVAGVVHDTARGVTGIRVGDRVGVPWIYSTCGECEWCRKGDEPLCLNRQVTGLTVPGGFCQYIKAPEKSVIMIPEELSFSEAAPFFCSGVTAYAALQLAGVSTGTRVAVYGIGGMGQMAIQIAKHFGSFVVALTGKKSKERLCRELGADQCHVGTTEELARNLRNGQGCDVILSTVPDPSNLGWLVPSLRGNGRLVIAGAGPGEMKIKPKELISRRLKIMGSRVGTRKQMGEVLELASQGRISAKTVERPLSAVNESIHDLRNNKVDGRIVLIP